MKKELTKAFNLPPDLQIKEIKDQKEKIIVSCKTKKGSCKCPHCNSNKTTWYDTVENRKLHTVLNGKKVFLQISKRRWKCKSCNKVFTEKIKGMEGQRTTNFFNQLVQEKSCNQDYASVARELKIHPTTVIKKQDLLSLDKFLIPKKKSSALG